MDVQASPAGGGLMLHCRSCGARTTVPLELTMFEAVNHFLARHRFCHATLRAGQPPPQPASGIPHPVAS